MIETVTFEDVFPIWKMHLWPHRESAIESNSAMTWLGGIDMSLMLASATFWKFQNAVLSGHYGGMINGERAFRTRGLWVPPESRGQGVATSLMQTAFETARRENCVVVWTYPRKSSIGFYESNGFKRVGPWVDDQNCYAIAHL